MNKSGKKYIKGIERYFDAPEPQEKSSFLEKIHTGQARGRDLPEIEKLVYKKTSTMRMLLVQLSFISKWMWILSALVFLYSFIISMYIQEEIMWRVSALVPFIVTFSLSESLRSITYGMGEFEMAAKFPLKSIIMSRMFILGIGNMLLLFMVAALWGESMWRNIVYMLVPYLASATGGLVILRKFISKEGIYISCAFSALISVLHMAGSQYFVWLYQIQFTGLWVITAAALLIITGFECYKAADTVGSSF